jgi:hypothetical protein
VYQLLSLANPGLHFGENFRHLNLGHMGSMVTTCHYKQFNESGSWDIGFMG